MVTKSEKALKRLRNPVSWVCNCGHYITKKGWRYKNATLFLAALINHFAALSYTRQQLQFNWAQSMIVINSQLKYRIFNHYR